MGLTGEPVRWPTNSRSPSRDADRPAASVEKQTGADLEPFRQLAKVRDRQRPLAFEDFRSQARVDAQQTGQVRGVHLVLFQQVLERMGKRAGLISADLARWTTAHRSRLPMRWAGRYNV